MSTSTRDAPTGTPTEQLAAAVVALLSTSSLDVEHTGGGVIKGSAAGVEFTLTVALGGQAAPDPLAHIRVGDYVSLDQRKPGGGEVCRAVAPESGTPACSREKGHPGQHFRTHDGHVREVWVNDGAKSGPDLDKVEPGDRLGGARFPEGDGATCGAYNGEQWYCSRDRDHTGQHVAWGGNHVLDTWSGSRRIPVDHLDGVTTGDTDPTRNYDRTCLVLCGYDIAGDECTRGEGHIGQHIGGDGDEVLDRRYR